MAELPETHRSEPPGDFERLLRAIIERSVKYRSAAVLIAVAILVLGIWSAAHLSLDVTPDISNVQVQVLTPVSDLSPEEIETSVTRPIELEMFGLPGLEQVRSLTRFGVSQVCLIFADGTDLYRARQMVTERLAGTVGKLPPRTVAETGPAQFGPRRSFHLCAGLQAEQCSGTDKFRGSAAAALEARAGICRQALPEIRQRRGRNQHHRRLRPGKWSWKWTRSNCPTSAMT